MSYFKLSVGPLQTIIAFPFTGSLLTSLARREERAPSGDRQFFLEEEACRVTFHKVTHRGMNGYGWFHNIQYPKGDHNAGMNRRTVFINCWNICASLWLSVSLPRSYPEWIVAVKIVKYNKELICISKTLRKWSFLYFSELTLSFP